MPEIMIKGIPQKNILQVKDQLYDRLSGMLNCPVDWLMIESVHTDYYPPNDSDKTHVPHICVRWFPRPAETCQLVAEVIYEVFRPTGIGCLTVYFEEMQKNHYFSLGNI